ncbi:phosphoribosyl-ATP diphosphatase [bacterium]|nr:phosphoribosyl-ATP diphosphatase [bacterium]
MNKKFTLADLDAIIAQRKSEPNPGSYTARLLQKGADQIERKVLEEAMEVILESHDGQKERLISELGDLLYHLLVLAAFHNISLSDIEQHLAAKHKSLQIL